MAVESQLTNICLSTERINLEDFIFNQTTFQIKMCGTTTIFSCILMFWYNEHSWSKCVTILFGINLNCAIMDINYQFSVCDN
jgi:hypothetical protein